MGKSNIPADGHRAGKAGDVNLPEMGIAAVVAGLKAGDFSAEEYVRALLAQAQHWHGLNAFISLDEERAIALARASDTERRSGRASPLSGLPLVVKDNIEVAGLPTTGGTPALRDNISAKNAPAVSRLLAQGAFVLGKTNLHELACGATSRNESFGHVRTPYDPARCAGGSSGGTAAALAARIAPAGLGTDTGASVRHPSSFCGTAALRPTVGTAKGERRYPSTGVVPISLTTDTIGPMARTVEDVALLDAAIVGRPPVAAADLRNVRLAIPRDPFWRDLDPDVEALCLQAVDRLSACGVTFVETDLLTEVNMLNDKTSDLVLWEFRLALPAYLSAANAGIGWQELIEQVAAADVRCMMARADMVTEQQYCEARDHWRPRLLQTYDLLFRDAGVDGYLIPVTPGLPPLANDGAHGSAGMVPAQERLAEFGHLIRNLGASAMAGLPGLAFPAGLTREGLPVGIEIDGPAGSDDRLLAIGMAAEAALARIPPPPLPFQNPNL